MWASAGVWDPPCILAIASVLVEASQPVSVEARILTQGKAVGHMPYCSPLPKNLAEEHIFKVCKNQCASKHSWRKLEPLQASLRFPAHLESTNLLPTAEASSSCCHGDRGCREWHFLGSWVSCLWVQDPSLAYKRRLIDVCGRRERLSPVLPPHPSVPCCKNDLLNVEQIRKVEIKKKTKPLWFFEGLLKYNLHILWFARF